MVVVHSLYQLNCSVKKDNLENQRSLGFCSHFGSHYLFMSRSEKLVSVILIKFVIRE